MKSIGTAMQPPAGTPRVCAAGGHDGRGMLHSLLQIPAVPTAVSSMQGLQRFSQARTMVTTLGEPVAAVAAAAASTQARRRAAGRVRCNRAMACWMAAGWLRRCGRESLCSSRQTASPPWKPQAPLPNALARGGLQRAEAKGLGAEPSGCRSGEEEKSAARPLAVSVLAQHGLCTCVLRTADGTCPARALLHRAL